MPRPPRSRTSPAPAGEPPVPRSNADGPDLSLRVAVVLFALSGCSALIYEIVWFQLLELVVGSSAISLGILLGIFMAGMCLGSLLLPRLVPDRIPPFRVYALLEFGIGALALLVWFEVPLVRHLYTGSGSHGLTGLLLRAVIAGLCLLPPTILMGAALPAVARQVDSSPRGLGWLGLLYGSNTVGAVLGCLLAGFWLLRVHDMGTATVVAAAINGVVGLAALVLAGQGRPARPAPVAGGERAATAHTPWLVYTAIGISGFCALGGEVVWTRLLALLLGGTVYTFSIILAVFLAGIGLGSGAGSVLAGASAHPKRAFGVCQVMLAAAVAWAAYVVGRSLPYWPIASSLAADPWTLFQLDLVRCLWALLPAAILWGASFPLALAASEPSSPKRQDAGRLVGAVYAANTIGAIAGALAFTFVILPAFGSHVAQQVLIALSVLAGLGLLAASEWAAWKGAGRAVVAVGLGVVAVLGWGLVRDVPPVPGDLIAFGRALAYRLGARDPRTNAPVALPDKLYVGEGMSESVAVTSNGRVRTYHVSGKIEASTSPKDMRLQSLLGNIPALVHPNPRSVLIVGFGAGVTAGTFVLYPGVERIVICEIEPLVPRKVSQFFRAENNDVFTDKRVEIVYDDARHYMLTTREKFDIITSDPIHPWVKGSASLYSRDYFELVLRHLNPGGVVTQWVPLYQSSPATVKGELATFFSVFRDGSVWANTDDHGMGYDLVLLGGNSRTVVDLGRLDSRLKRPDHLAVARALQAVGFPSSIDLMSKYTTRARDLAPWLAGARINEDVNLWLQYQAGLESHVEQEAEIFAAISEYRVFPEDLFVGPDELKQRMLNGGGAASAP